MKMYKTVSLGAPRFGDHVVLNWTAGVRQNWHPCSKDAEALVIE